MAGADWTISRWEARGELTPLSPGKLRVLECFNCARRALMSTDLEQLTRREQEIGSLVSEGLTYREIADKLFISRRTAEWHVEQILNKLGMRSRSQIAVRFAQSELLHSLRSDGARALQTSWPAQPNALLGRDRELADINELILRAEVRVVTISGPPGVGKTSLGILSAQMSAESLRRRGLFC